MGLPMYVSPSLSKRQLPPKQPQSPYEETDYSGDLYQNSRTSAFGNRYFIRRPYASEISDWLQPRNPSSQPPIQNEQLRPQRIRRSSSLPYNNLVQHIQRLGNLPHLHRTREQHIASSGLATRRGMQLQSAQLLHIAQLQAQHNSSNTSTPNNETRHGDSPEEMNNSNFSDPPVTNPHPTELPSSSAPESVNNNVTNTSQTHNNSSAALDNVFRRVNIHRLLTQDNRSMRPGSRNHRSSSGHRSSSTRTALAREDLIQRGIDMPPLIRVTGPYIQSGFSDTPESLPPLPPLPRRLRHSVRRGNVAPSYDSRSNFGEDVIDNYDNYLSHILYDDPEGSAERSHTSRILSPIPRRYEPRLTASFAVVSPNGMLVESRERINVNSGTNSSNTARREIQEGSASGEVC